MEINQTISKYVLTERVGHRVLSINIEINHVSKRYSITSYDALRKEFGFIGTDKTGEIKVICGMIARAAEFADEELGLSVIKAERGYPLMREVFEDKLLSGIEEILEKECIIYYKGFSDISVLKLLSTEDLDKYGIIDAGTINYIISILANYNLKLKGE